jgi:hypothetical protein
MSITPKEVISQWADVYCCTASQTKEEADAEADELIEELNKAGFSIVKIGNCPTVAMLEAARDWSIKKYGKPIGDDAAVGCWKAMSGAARKGCHS